METGLLAEFRTPEDLVRVVRELRARGYQRLDAFSPYPVHGLEEAIGLTRSNLNLTVFPLAVLGAAFGFLVQWWCNAHDYKLNVGGRPLNSIPASIPITFEAGVLTASLLGLLVLLILCKLPALYSPLFDVPGFERASIDRFWVGIDERDPSFDELQGERDLRELGALSVGRARWRLR